MEGTDCNVEEMNKTLEHSLGGLGNGVVLNDPTRILVSHKVTATIMSLLMHILLINIIIGCGTIPK